MRPTRKCRESKKWICSFPNASAVQFYHGDHLGSTRIMTDASGTKISDCTYGPYGEEISCSPSNASNHYKFTGKERDSESGLDFLDARHYASALGRFMSVDPVAITPARKLDPQQFNRYGYVRNNPLRLVDPTGETLECNGSDKEACFSVLQQIAGNAADRLSMDANTGVISFNATGLDLGANEGAALVSQLVSSSNTYGLALSDTANTAGGPVKLNAADPWSNLDNQADIRYSKGKSPTDLPPKGVDDQVTIDPKNATLFKDSQDRSVSLSSSAFHELAEAYSKVDGGKQYSDFQTINAVNATTVEVGSPQRGAHNEAVQREFKLREQRPNLKTSGRAGDQLIRDPHN